MGRLLLFASLVAGLALSQEPGPPQVTHCVLTDGVDAGSAAYLQDCVKSAQEARHAAVLIRVDTPGGSLESTRQIVRSFLASEVPVLVWVGPSGARAGSAGVFITIASHFAGMAPGTNIGAAHPVMGPTGQDPGKAGGDAMEQKVVNDTVAFAEAIAQQRGRNAQWAAKAVRESASISAEEAVSLDVVDTLASSEEELLTLADGAWVEINGEKRQLQTRGAQLIELSPTFRQRLVHWLSNPAIAYLLFVIGSLGLTIELAQPGLIAPGVIGVVALVLALVAFAALPVQTGAVVLLVLGVGLIVAELFVASGLLGAGGALLLALGGVLLVDRFDPSWFVEPSFAIPWRVVIPTAIAMGAAAAYLVLRAGQARKLPQQAGDLGLLGEQGKAIVPIGPEGGEAFVHGERWSAVSDKPIPPGAPVVVRQVKGLTLGVEEVIR